MIDRGGPVIAPVTTWSPSIEDATPNPYTPPNETNAAGAPERPIAFTRGQKKGPALYIVLGGLLGGIALLILYNPFGSTLPLVGCVAGGIVYRIRARDWPIDPTGKSRQWRYILAVLSIVPVMTLVPGTTFLFFGLHAEDLGMAMVGGSVSLAVSAGILVSGTRRHAETS